MMKQKTILVLRIWVMILALLSVGAVQAADLRITDSNPMQMPAVGSYNLRILSPTLLEVTLISAKQPDPATLTEWNFVNSNGQLSAPAPSSFVVTAGTQTIAVQSVGFKRRPLFAPLKTRDLRIENNLYLTLASAIADGQTVQVTNPNGTLWSTAKQFVTQADPLRLSPVIHVNQEGYMPNYAKKAMVSYYLGSMGEMNVAASLGFKLVDANSGAVVFTGSLTSRKDVGYTYSPIPYQAVLEADFTSFNTPGEYRLQVPGLGASFSFLIDQGIAGNFARTYALGLYHQRCGGANDYPHTRHVKGACHMATVEVPDMTFTAVNNELANMTGDYASSQSGAPQLKDVNSSLYPFVNHATFDVSGGHHDAGDYSKYTINVAQLLHSLVFAADAFSGAAALDNLGLPESGDGKSDLLQEAKWEADFLAKLQDADGGFYFLVYPRNREYEDDLSLVAPYLGDSQVVFPKTTAVTAAAVAALAQTASSPLFKQLYPTEAASYLVKAQKGWSFLTNAWALHGRAGAYQKITHYGNEFRDADEIAWAACELYLATGNTAYQTELINSFDPSDPNTRRWTWWRMFEGYGCAIRSYAFAARTGRLNASQLNPTFLAKCNAEIKAAGDDQVTYAQHNAFGNSFPDPNKPYRSAGWFFSVNQTFDIAVAQQLYPSQTYLDTIVGNMNYEAGCNPLNMTFVTGIGWKRQRETVNQYAENDRRILPPSGIPQGSVQQGPPYISLYQGELNALCFPSDSATSAPYAPYDKWTDTFNTTTEFVNPQQGCSLASMAFMMAQTSVKTQAWKSAVGTITGLPASVPAQQNITASLSVPGIDMSKATLVWEGTDQQPTPGSTFTFAAANSGPQWVEVEALLPDGRRVFATANFNATTATNTPPNSYQSAPLTVATDMVALYHLDSNFTDATGKEAALALAGNAALDSSNLGWMANRTGAALHFLNIGDKATLTIPAVDTYATDTQAVIVEAMVYVNAYKGYNIANSPLVSLVHNWASSLDWNEDMYAGPVFKGGASFDVRGAQVTNALSPKVWHHLRMAIDKTGYSVKIDGVTLSSMASADLANWSANVPSTLTIGNFDGWVDELTIRNVRTNTPANTAPVVSLTSPTTGSSVVAGSNLTLGATATDSGGSVAKVEFFQGTTKLGEDLTSPYSLVWNNVVAGNYSLTAKATDNLGATTSSSAVSISITNVGTVLTVATPTISPAGATFTNSVSVSLACATTGVTIRYTTDGSVPNANSTVYSSAISLSQSTTVKAFAMKTGMTDSAVLSSSFTISVPPASTNKATFVKTDTTTRGNWKGVYGANGYAVVNNATNYPAYAQVSMSGNFDWTWTASLTDLGALQQAASTTARIAACLYSTNSFTIDLNLTDAKTHRVALYCYDFDNMGRVETIDILDGVTGTVLNTQTISAFSSGKYLVWDLSGKVKIRVTKNTGQNAVVSGLFFSAPPPVATANRGVNGQFQVRIVGEIGQSFVVEASTNLQTWTALSTITLNSTTYDYTDPNMGSFSSRFYRARPTP